MSGITWVQYTERVVAEGHPSREDVTNRPLKQLLAMHGFAPNAEGPFFARYDAITGGVGLHAPTHLALGADPVDVKQLAGYPGGTTSYLRADGTFAVPPGGGGGGSGATLNRATLVQQKEQIAESGNITLGATPTPGNFLVWLAGTWNSPAPSAGDNWQLLCNVGGLPTDGARAFYRMVRTGDTTVVTTPQGSTPAGQSVTCFEVNSPGGPPVLFDYVFNLASQFPTLNGIVLNDSSFMVGIFNVVSNSADDPVITCTGSTVTELLRGTGTSVNGSPRQTNPFSAPVERGARTVVGTYSASRTNCAIAVVFPPGVTGSGGGSGSPAGVLGFASVLTDSVVNPEVVGFTLINGMSVTFTLLASTVIEVAFTVRATHAGGATSAIAIMEGATCLWPFKTGAAADFYLSNEAEGYAGTSFTGIFTLAAGTHTIGAYHRPAVGITNVTWHARCISVRALT